MSPTGSGRWSRRLLRGHLIGQDASSRSGSEEQRMSASHSRTLLVQVLQSLFLAWLAWGCLLFYWSAGIRFWGLWILRPIVWLAVRTVVVALTAPAKAEWCLKLPVGERRGREGSWLQRWLLRIHPWGRVVGVTAVFASLAVFDRPLRLLPLVFLAAAAVWWYPALATINYLGGCWGGFRSASAPGVLDR